MTIKKAIKTCLPTLYLLFISALFVLPGHGQTKYDKTIYLTEKDKQLAAEMTGRESDWRNGAVVYQIIVDRFAPSSNLESKKEFYKHPRSLRKWEELPKVGPRVEGTDNHSHELEFWGGDLNSVASKIDYLHDLGIDVVYLNPIHEALTNHKYDAIDYNKVSPEYGTREDVKKLAEALHNKDMKLVLDGVFNHMGSSSPYFKDALENENSPYRDWFFVGDEYKKGYRGWIDAAALPELRLENPEVQNYIYADENSVVQSYLNDGVDGWRLDVAFDVGPVYLKQLRSAAHNRKPGSLVIGEIWSYPEDWYESVDAIMNFPARKIIESTLENKVDGPTAGLMFETMVDDSGIENILKSWVLLDNHDTKRLKSMFEEDWQREMAQVLQFTLPGSPNLYYGVELGMEGGDDPLNRAPMRWDLLSENNLDFIRTKQLIQLRNQYRALRIGNYRSVVSSDLWAFERYTEKALETMIVLVNPSGEVVRETVMIRNSKIMNGVPAIDVLTDEKFSEIRSGLMYVEMPPYTIKVLRIETFDNEWNPFERIF